MNLHVLYRRISLLWADDFFHCHLQRGSLLAASGKLRATLFPMTDGTTSIARRHFLQLFDGFSCAPCTASTFWVESSRFCRMLKFLSCISRTDQSFLFLTIQLVPLLWTILTLILKSCQLDHHHCFHEDGNSRPQHIHQGALALSPASRRSSLTSSRFFAKSSGWWPFWPARVVSALGDDLHSRNFSFREIRRSHQPVSSTFLIEINDCVLLQSNRENFITEKVILTAFSLALSHVKIVIQCLLSKLLRKFSITVVFEALNDIVHCWLRNILCSELFSQCFRLSVQTSPIQPWSLSVTVFHLELNLPEPHISFPLSKFFVNAAIELAHLLILSAFCCTWHRRGSQLTWLSISVQSTRRGSRLRYQCKSKNKAPDHRVSVHAGMNDTWMWHATFVWRKRARCEWRWQL